MVGIPFRRKNRSSVSTASVSNSNSNTLSTASLPSPPAPAPFANGDQPKIIPLGQYVSPLEIRDLNELIRKRYALDADIWDLKDCMPCDREIALDMMRRSDAALAKIMGILKTWDNPHVWESLADLALVKKIRERLETTDGGKRMWQGNPPWQT